ncbi:sugar ABC transporter ATP-binding protein [Burkholderia oklahomensis]|uniref:sugar ABC transporter ATP-binding protein n=1 Tax=Burkholderia oklahomensis TaxID=342113 RepID=UPI0026525887|nr:sugar ABC transporter ATP-binding protein [Burkholderia oklahomensis]MDN7671139.1 sugar ABC transporter ATP-binding protein [Burkholderia oklahomensis]
MTAAHAASVTPDVDAPLALDVRRVVKRFNGVAALRGASLAVPRGTVHGLIGQNGAGKSTLIKLLAGPHAPDEGEIVVGGAPLAAGGARAGSARKRAARIGFIHQERLLPATFTVAEALFFPQPPTLGGASRLGRLLPLDVGRMRRDCRAVLHEQFGVDLPPDRLIGELSVAEQQIVQITSALIRHGEILVFDEPTAALVSSEVDRLLQTIERLRADGHTILYVSHYLDEIARVCDRVTVLRDGVDVAHLDARAASLDTLIAAMIGAPHANAALRSGPAAPRTPGEVALDARELALPGRFGPLSLSVRRGEVVGLTGVLGSGGKDVIRALFGLARGTRGDISIDGRAVRVRRPRDAVAHGIALVPENRLAHGVAGALSVRGNIVLASLARVSRFGFVRGRRETAAADALIRRLDIRPARADWPVRFLSGGNQQKVALAKWLGRASTVYLLDEPTAGVDVGAKAQIYRLIDELARSGAAVLLFTSDLTELLDVTDRVYVMARGEIVAARASARTTTQDVLAWATLARGPQRDDAGAGAPAAANPVEASHDTNAAPPAAEAV